MTKLFDEIRQFHESFEQKVLIENKRLIAQATKELAGFFIQQEKISRVIYLEKIHLIIRLNLDSGDSFT
ncbi:hypothetical protein ABES25_06605 [Bacillus gobiensis]|uniref:hypothetical protein n=1 Tax=Bacillus gobiensis TaxID=1441095 RepID=UPI003D1E2F95